MKEGIFNVQAGIVGCGDTESFKRPDKRSDKLRTEAQQSSYGDQANSQEMRNNINSLSLSLCGRHGVKKDNLRVRLSECVLFKDSDILKHIFIVLHLSYKCTLSKGCVQMCPLTISLEFNILHFVT